MLRLEKRRAQGGAFALPWAILLCPFGAWEMRKLGDSPSPSRYGMYLADFV